MITEESTSDMSIQDLQNLVAGQRRDIPKLIAQLKIEETQILSKNLVSDYKGSKVPQAIYCLLLLYSQQSICQEEAKTDIEAVKNIEARVKEIKPSLIVKSVQESHVICPVERVSSIY